ncbi:hypothetical protein FPE01S_03_04140 [Flavihumibacter petaseus NBRC 106054]|uniref:Carboxypeptidase regulatory-like domain-containing protein n=1 Tax=Flavihumibacter petaseus NBRC 106054 TaxID=1220578 RepID=A0A0E9N3Z3_9BACT|nr:hypothetical protein FPE01S_03_04140 [Flavihumibacter petaseus NBRC 106054]
MGCQKPHDEAFTPPTDRPEPGNSLAVKADFRGRILDLAGFPVPGATVSAGNTSTGTNINGEFELQNASVDSLAAVISVNKPGFLNGYRTLIASRSINYVVIKILPEQKHGSVQAGAGGRVDFSNGGALVFSGGSFISSDSSAYQGRVDVMARFIDPLEAGAAAVMPGNQLAIDQHKHAALLKSFGVLAVELRGEDNQVVHLATGKPATLHFPVPASLRAQAPVSVPLWYFDAVKGLWREEGTAIKTGNEYIGTVIHFSFWSCAVPEDYVVLQADLETNTGAPLSFASVRMQTDTSRAVYGITDGDGFIQGYVPKGRQLQMTVLDECGNATYTGSYGPYTGDVYLGTVQVQPVESQLLQFEGDVVNCSGDPLADGSITIDLGNRSLAATITDGHFALGTINCQNFTGAVRLYFYDNTSQKEKLVTLSQVANGINEVPVTAICDVSDASTATIETGGQTYTFNTPADVVSFNLDGSFDIVRPDSSVTLYFWADQISGTGNYPLFSMRYRNNEPNTEITQLGLYPNESKVEITSFGSIGEFIAGKIDIQAKDPQGELHPIKATFRIKRQF